MLYPHLRFAAYLLARKLPLEKFIKDLPIPDVLDITTKYPNVSTRTKWLSNAGLMNIHKKRPWTAKAYLMWQNPEIRAFMMCARFMKQNPELMLKDHFRFDADENTIDEFYTIFMDTDYMDIVDWREYCDALNNDSIDATSLHLCLDKKTWTYVQDHLGIRPLEIDHDDILADILMQAYRQYQETGNIKYANLAIKVQREMRDPRNVSKRNAVKDISIKLEEFDTRKTIITLEQLHGFSPSDSPPSLTTDPS